MFVEISSTLIINTVSGKGGELLRRPGVLWGAGLSPILPIVLSELKFRKYGKYSMLEKSDEKLIISIAPYITIAQRSKTKETVSYSFMIYIRAF